MKTRTKRFAYYAQPSEWSNDRKPSRLVSLQVASDLEENTSQEADAYWKSKRSPILQSVGQKPRWKISSALRTQESFSLKDKSQSPSPGLVSNVLVVGTGKSGKTTLAAALIEAGQQLDIPNAHFSYLPNRMTESIRMASIGNPHFSSGRHRISNQYQVNFRLQESEKDRTNTTKTIRFHFFDGGNSLSSSARWSSRDFRNFSRFILGVSTLFICCDMRDPKTVQLARDLPSLMFGINKARRFLKEKNPEIKFKPITICLIFNFADQFLLNTLKNIHPTGTTMPKDLQTKVDLAEKLYRGLDQRHIMIQLLGQTCLDRIKAPLEPQDQLLGCICSSTGLLLAVENEEKSSNKINHSGEPVSSSEERKPITWEPFGMHSLFHYMTDGQIQDGLVRLG